MKRFMKKFRYGEKGFTLIELLIVVAILGILAAVIVPNLAGFLSTGQQAGANTEVANVETAALGYYADNNGWPANSNLLVPDYLSANTTYQGGASGYTFDSYGKVGPVDADALTLPNNGDTWPPDTSVTWSTADHEWQK